MVEIYRSTILRRDIFMKNTRDISRKRQRIEIEKGTGKESVERIGKEETVALGETTEENLR